MRFCTNAVQLRNAVKRCTNLWSHSLKKEKTIDLSARDKSITVSVASGDERLVEQADAEVEEGGETITLRSERLLAILAKESEGLQFQLISEGKSKLIQVIAQSAAYEIGVEPAKPKPVEDDYTETASFECSCEDMARAFSLAGITDSIEVYKQYSMNIVAIKVEGDNALICCCDPKRGVISRSPITGLRGDWPKDGAVVPDRACVYTLGMMKGKETARFSVAGPEVRFAVTDRFYAARQSIGRMPDLKAIMRPNSEFEFTLPAGELLGCVSKAMTMLTETNWSCRVNWENGKLHFASYSEKGKADAWLECEDIGFPNKVHVFDPELLADFCKRLKEDEQVKIGFKKTKGMVMIHAERVEYTFAEIDR